MCAQAARRTSCHCADLAAKLVAWLASWHLVVAGLPTRRLPTSCGRGTHPTAILFPHPNLPVPPYLEGSDDLTRVVPWGQLILRGCRRRHAGMCGSSGTARGRARRARRAGGRQVLGPNLGPRLACAARECMRLPPHTRAHPARPALARRWKLQAVLPFVRDIGPVAAAAVALVAAAAVDLSLLPATCSRRESDMM